MKRLVAVLAVSLTFAACGEPETAPAEAPLEGAVLDSAQEAAPPEGTLSLQQAAGLSEGRFVAGDAVVSFRSREVEPGVFSVEVNLNGLALAALMDPDNGAGALDGFAEANGADTQLVDEDRLLLQALGNALNRELPEGDAAAPAARYLRRSVSLWAQHPTTVELERTVLGEQGRGYTMLCSYAKCNGSYTGGCGGAWNWYYYAKHDCQHGGFSAYVNQQIAQLGNHGTCSGDEYYYTSTGWKCGEPDHWSRPKVYGNCFGRCGGGCGGDTQYTLDATNHDGCVRNGHVLASGYCDDQFTSASDDELFAGNCY